MNLSSTLTQGPTSSMHIFLVQWSLATIHHRQPEIASLLVLLLVWTSKMVSLFGKNQTALLLFEFSLLLHCRIPNCWKPVILTDWMWVTYTTKINRVGLHISQLFVLAQEESSREKIDPTLQVLGKGWTSPPPLLATQCWSENTAKYAKQKPCTRT